jgi:hypothetical protein
LPPHNKTRQIISLEIIVFEKMTVSLFILCLKMSVKALTKLDLVSSYDFFYSAKILIHSLLFSPNDPGSKQAGRPPKNRGRPALRL